MVAGTMFAQLGLSAFGGKSFVDLEWEPPVDFYGAPVDAFAIRMRSAVLEAEKAFHAGEFGRVEMLLADFGPQLDAHGRRILIEAAFRGEHWGQVIKYTTPPETISALVFQIEALRRLGQYVQAYEALERYGAGLGLPDVIRRDIVEHLDTQRAIQQT